MEENNSFFQNYLDDLMSQSYNQQEPEEDAQPQEQDNNNDSDFIKGLKDYDNEQNSQQNNESALFDKLSSLIDQKLEGLNTTIAHNDWFASDEGQDYMSLVFDTQNGDETPGTIPYSPNASANGFYSSPAGKQIYSANSFREKIAAGESGGNYSAANSQPGQTAYGKYQFTKAARQDAYNNTGGSSKWGSFQNYENQFKNNPQVQEDAMTNRMAQAQKIVGDDPIAQALYHYAPKFGIMYSKGQLDLNKKPSDYGIGVGVKNPTFKEFLKSHNIAD